MLKQNDAFVVEYNENDEQIVNEILQVLDVHKKRIMDFFGIDKVSKKVEIVIYDDLQKYIDYITPYLKREAEEIRQKGGNPQVDSYQDWMIGDTFNGKINMLNLDLCRQSKEHNGMTMKEFLITPIHEFVHICHREFLGGKSVESWAMEGIATYLAGQDYYKVDKIDCTAQDLKGNFTGLEFGYHYAYTIMEYLVNNTSHKDLLKILQEPQKVDLQNVIDETNENLLNNKYDQMEKS